jgi:hypothetical protein
MELLDGNIKGGKKKNMEIGVSEDLKKFLLESLSGHNLDGDFKRRCKNFIEQHSKTDADLRLLAIRMEVTKEKLLEYYSPELVEKSYSEFKYGLPKW